MNTFQLTCFLAVAETLNFAQAAELRGITQPAITHQIHTLEAELNVKLFNRTTRTVRLTQDGQTFLNDARSIVMISERAIKRFENPPNQEIRTFSLGCHIHGHLFLLPEVLHRIANLYPNLHPRIQVVPFKHLYRLLSEDDVDVIVAFRENNARKMSFIYKELGKIPIVGYCAANHPLAKCSCLSIADLEQQKLILHDPKKSPDSIALLQMHLMESHTSSELFFCDSEEAAITLAQAGYGIAVLPGLHIANSSRLVRIPVADLEPLSFGMYYKTLTGNPILKDFVQLARETIQFQKIM